MEPVNTRLDYLYRDASNYKQTSSVVFTGTLSAADRERFVAALDRGEWFIAEQVGLVNLRERWASPSEDDHIWHESAGLWPTDEPADDGRSIVEFVDEVERTTWDEPAAVARLEVWQRGEAVE